MTGRKLGAQLQELGGAERLRRLAGGMCDCFECALSVAPWRCSLPMISSSFGMRALASCTVKSRSLTVCLSELSEAPNGCLQGLSTQGRHAGGGVRAEYDATTPRPRSSTHRCSRGLVDGGAVLDSARMGDESDEQEREETKRQRFIGFEEDLSSIQVPDELPVLPLRGVVIFPVGDRAAADLARQLAQGRRAGAGR